MYILLRILYVPSTIDKLYRESDVVTAMLDTESVKYEGKDAKATYVYTVNEKKYTYKMHSTPFALQNTILLYYIKYPRFATVQGKFTGHPLLWPKCVIVTCIIEMLSYYLA